LAGMRARYLLVVVLLGLTLACKRHTDAKLRAARPTGSAPGALSGKQLAKDWTLQGSSFSYRFAIYLPAAPKLDLKRELASAVAGTGVSVVTEAPEREPPPASTSIFLRLPKIEEFAPPPADSMEFRAKDLSPAEQQRLMQSRFVAVFEVAGPGSRAR